MYGVYNTEMKVSLSFRTGSPIMANAGQINIVDDLIDYSISDGVQTLTPSNSTILFFSVEVDSANQVSRTGITIWRNPIPTFANRNDTVGGIDLYVSPTFIQAFGFLDGQCIDFFGPNDRCSSASSTLQNSGSFLFFDEIFRNGFDF